MSTNERDPNDEQRDWELLVGAKLGLSYSSGGRMFDVTGRLQYVRLSSSGVVLHLETAGGPVDVSSNLVQDALVLSPPKDGGGVQKDTLESHIKALLGKPEDEGLVSKPAGIAAPISEEEFKRFDRLGWIGAAEQLEFTTGLAFMCSECPEEFRDIKWPD